MLSRPTFNGGRDGASKGALNADEGADICQESKSGGALKASEATDILQSGHSSATRLARYGSTRLESAHGDADFEENLPNLRASIETWHVVIGLCKSTEFISALERREGASRVERFLNIHPEEQETKVDCVSGMRTVKKGFGTQRAVTPSAPCHNNRHTIFR